jgi:histidinol-phosphate phosphatase family protein
MSIRRLHLLPSRHRKPQKAGNQDMSACDYVKKYRKTGKTQKAVFFDRDGTLHVDKVETTLEKGLELFPDTAAAVRKARKKGYRIIIVTNQSGIAKGHITLKQMHRFNRALRLRLACRLCSIDAIYYCPHQKSDNCHCMKPDTGMFDRAKKEFNIDMKKSYIVGDKTGDIQAAKNAGIPKEHWMMVTTGIYDDNDFHTEPDLTELDPGIFRCLKDAVDEMQ